MGLPEKCPLCEANICDQDVVTSHVFGGKHRTKRAFFQCRICDVRYQFPRLTAEEELNFYAQEFEEFMESRTGLAGSWQNSEHHIEIHEETRLRRMNYLADELVQRTRILEFGCSSGFMLYPLMAMGYECTGIEPSGVFRDFVRQKGVPAYRSLDEMRASNLRERFDLIMHFFVLEHISSPLDFLNQQLEILNPGGIIVFEIPNVADPLFALYDVPDFERFYWSVAHPWYFSVKSLDYLLSKLDCHYTITLEQRYDLSNHIIWARDGRPGGMGRFNKVFDHEFNEKYKETLIRSGFCDTLICTIRKPQED